MDQFKDQKEMKMAMNGRMGLMTGGIILIFTAISTTMMYGINLFGLASEIEKGNTEFAGLLEAADMSLGLLRVVAACFLILAVIEVFAGFLSARLCNRLDKAEKTKKLVIALLALEILMQVFLLITRMMNLSMLFTSLIIPLYMLWGVTRLCKLAKIYPDRTYALNTKKMKEQRRPASPAKPAQAKSLRERAMLNTSKPEETAESEDTPEPAEESVLEDTPAPREESVPEGPPESTENSVSEDAPKPAEESVPENPPETEKDPE